MRTQVLSAALAMTATFGALANQVDFEGRAQLFQSNLPEKVLSSHDYLRELSTQPQVFIEAENSPYFEQLMNRALAKGERGQDNFLVMYHQTETNTDESELSIEQRNFLNEVRSKLNNAYIQFEVSTETSFYKVSCIKEYSIDYEQLSYKTRSGCFLPVKKIKEISKLIQSSNTSINLIAEKDAVSILEGNIPESLRENKDLLILADIYGEEAAILLGMGSYMYNRPIRAVISGTYLYLITSGSNTTTVFADLKPMSDEDKMKYAPETLGSETVESRMSEDGSVVCHQKEAEKNAIVFGGSKETECLYKLSIARFLSTIQR
ncbi:MAG: hypothetical protein VYA54_08555 [Bdellovibrionota bacterium]|nr:hypothetical protein [Bdellovibrionota bacterium]